MKKRGNIVLWIGIIFIMAVIILGLVFIVDLSEYFFGGIKNSNAKGEYLKTILQISGGIVIILGAYQSLKIVDSMNDNNKLVEKGNIAERFKNAIAMLEEKNSNTCLGGIYSLDNIAKDNEEYREQVFNILISFINNKTKDMSSWDEIPIPKRFDVSPSIEVQTIIKILFSKDKILYRNLLGDFKDSKLYGGNFDDMNFTNCSFSDVEFQNSSFRKTFFINCNVNRTNYTYSQIINADFTGSKIYKSILECCFFTFTHFTAARIKETSFICSNINTTDFQGSIAQLCSFNGAKLVYFRHDVNKFSFNGANINGASIKGMNVIGGIIAKGAKFDVSQPASNFITYIESYIGNKLEFNSANAIEEFPESEYERLKYLLEDPLPESKIFNHTLKLSLKPSGWKFSDTGVFTKEDCNKLINKYDETLKKVGIKKPKIKRLNRLDKIKKLLKKRIDIWFSRNK